VRSLRNPNLASSVQGSESRLNPQRHWNVCIDPGKLNHAEPSEDSGETGKDFKKRKHIHPSSAKSRASSFFVKSAVPNSAVPPCKSLSISATAEADKSEKVPGKT